VAKLVIGLQAAGNYPSGCLPAGSRTVAEIMEGLGADFKVVIPGSGEQRHTAGWLR
jgi:hypothetical protein